MGQKINPNIFRLENTQEWNSKYFEKKSTEFSLYAFKDAEIKKFIHKFFNDNGLAVQTIKLYYLEGSLHVFVSYLLTTKSIVLVNSLNKTQNIKVTPQTKQTSNKKKYNKIKAGVKKYFHYQQLNHNVNLRTLLKKNSLKKAKKIIKYNKQVLQVRRIKMLKYYKSYLATKNYKSAKNIKNNAFLEKIFESLAQFTNKKIKISLTLHQVNKDLKQTLTKKKLEVLKKSLTQLRKYKQNEFFKEGVNTLFSCVVKKRSSDLLVHFIANQLKKLKRHNFFIKFVKTTLSLFSGKTFSIINGIKIKIKGRFNGAPRAKHTIIQIGNGVPVLTLNSNISYSEATAYTSNGTFGVKIWIHEKI
uniref:Ribosomal protein S3 n=1 Tax=Berkeleya fennica TaxID=1577906 RepID=A0A0U1XY72_BERFE|nr:ribosomal protein S3 [Berkeleya fennica]AJA05820.1 ribosomal protein S3 [Berkeleya fennica]